MHLGFAELLFVLLSTILPGSLLLLLATSEAGVVAAVVSLSTVVVVAGVLVVEPDLRGSVAEMVLLIDALIRENLFGGALVYEPLPVVEVE